MASLSAPIAPPRHRQPLRRRLQFGLAALCVLALMAGSAVAIVLSVAMTQLRAEISRTDELERYASALEVALLEQQSGFRGYLPTGDDSHNARITVSIGVTASDTHGTDRMHLLKVADEALYAAKRSGRNRLAVADISSSPIAQPANAPTPISRAARSARKKRPVVERSSS
jgi:GGDEF domain-containing protein